MKDLITGGAGFMGYHLASRLADDGSEVWLVDDLSRGRVDVDLAALLERDNVRLVEADLSRPEALDELPVDCDRIFHLAAVIGVRNVMQAPERVISVNMRTLLNVLDWFCGRSTGRLLFASTSEVYAWVAPHDLPVPTPEDVALGVDDPGNPRASYAMSKALGEMAVIHTCKKHDRPFTIVRPHNVYGPRMGMAHVIPEVHARILEGEPPLIVYNTDHRRAFCYVDDAVEAFVRLMESSVPSDIYNVGNPTAETAIGELADLILELSGRPDVEIRSVAGEEPGIPRRCPDIGRLERATGFIPSVGLREGLEKTLSWYAEARR